MSEALWRRVVSLFAIAAMTMVLVGPFAAWTVWRAADGPGSFRAEPVPAGEELSFHEAGRSFAVWGEPADLDRGAVACTRDGEPLGLAPAETVDGRDLTLLLDDDFTVFDDVTCTGGGLESLWVSSAMAPESARRMIVVCLVLTVAGPVAGLLLRRAGYRWTR